MINAKIAQEKVQAYKIAKQEERQAKANEFLEKVVSPGIEGVASNGGTRFSFKIPSDVNSNMVCNGLRSAGYNLDVSLPRVVVVW